MAAAARAAHLVVDHEPRIFTDPLAERVLGEHAAELLGYHRAHGDLPVLAGARAQAVVRSRYAEDRLAASRATQHVVLGAGLDTSAHRSDRTVFEVDHPATQRWKRELLAAAGVPEPPNARYVPVDLAAEPLAPRLTAAGFDVTRPAFVTWLGVTTYLSWAAIDHVLAGLAGCAPGTELIFDYLLPPGARDGAGEDYAALVGRAAAERGEPWLTCPAPVEVDAHLVACGFTAAHHTAQRDAVAPELWRRTDSLVPTRLAVLARTTLSRPL
ncbi:SAM-dependent methyltransferase [Saccharothrix sp. SC076]|nr:SAM-dependent methyltransferase [Saccharothrix obliqua]